MKSIVIIISKCFILFSTCYLCYNLLFQGFETINFLKAIIYPSLFLTVLFTVIHVALSIKVGVKNNFSSIQNDSISTSVNLLELENKIERNFNWKLVNRTDTSLVFKSKFETLFTFGEIISIQQDNNEINLSSKPLLFTTIFDFGRNYKNINSIKSIL